MRKSMLKKIVFTILMLGVVSFSINAEAASQGPYIKDGSIVQVTKKNYGMWQNFSWKKKNNTTNVYNQTFQARGRYKHKNGQTYYSLYDSKGKWYGYLNSQATKKTARQGSYIADGSYVKITKKNYDMWQNFSWKKKGNTNSFYGKTLKAKGKYQHFNGATYYSLFDNKDKWCGYLNAAATQKTKPEGNYIKDGRFITITKKNYDIWQNFSWKKRNNSTNVYGRSFQAKGRFEHANGSVYYSLYDSQDNWLGYLNQAATSKYQPKELKLTKTINQDVNGKLLPYPDGYDKVSEKTEKEVILRAPNGDYTTLYTTTIIWKLKAPVTDNNKELKNAKNKAKETIAKLDLTASEKTKYNTEIDKAANISAVNTQLTNAKAQAEKNTKAKEEQKKLTEAKQKAKNTISTLKLSNTEKTTFSQDVDKAKSITAVNQVLSNAKNLSDKNNQSEEGAKKLTEAKATAKNTIATLNLTSTERTNFNNQLTNAKTTSEVTTIVESAKKQSDKNNQAAEATKKLAQAKKDALSNIEKMNLNDKKQMYINQINQGTTVVQINNIVAEAQKISDENKANLSLKQKKESAIKEINNLNNMTSTQKQHFIEQINQVKSINEIERVLTAAKKANEVTSDISDYKNIDTNTIINTTKNTYNTLKVNVADKKYKEYESINSILARKTPSTESTFQKIYREIEKDKDYTISASDYADLQVYFEINERYTKRMIENVNSLRMQLRLYPLNYAEMSDETKAAMLAHSMATEITGDHINTYNKSEVFIAFNEINGSSGLAENMMPMSTVQIVNALNVPMTAEALADKMFKAILNEYNYYTSQYNDNNGHLHNILGGKENSLAYGGLFIKDVKVYEGGIYGKTTKYTYSITELYGNAR